MSGSEVNSERRYRKAEYRCPPAQISTESTTIAPFHFLLIWFFMTRGSAERKHLVAAIATKQVNDFPANVILHDAECAHEKSIGMDQEQIGKIIGFEVSLISRITAKTLVVLEGNTLQNVMNIVSQKLLSK